MSSQSIRTLHQKKFSTLLSSESELIENLRNKKEAKIYLQVAFDAYLEDENIKALQLAFRHIAMAQGGITRLAQKTQLNREALYRILSENGNPTLLTLRKILNALGFRLKVTI